MDVFIGEPVANLVGCVPPQPTNYTARHELPRAGFLLSEQSDRMPASSPRSSTASLRSSGVNTTTSTKTYRYVCGHAIQSAK
jgi:hypothetical protein